MTTDFRKELISELKDLEKIRFSIGSMTEKLEVLSLEFEAIKATDYDKDVVTGGGENKREIAVLNNIAERDLTMKRLRAAKAKVANLDKALGKLNSEQYRALELFFIKPSKRKVEILRDEFNCEDANVYRVKDRALISLAKLLHGKAEL